MWKSPVLTILIPVQLLSFAFQALTGIFHAQLSAEFFDRYHPLNGYLLVILLLVHIAWNRDWLAARYGGRRESK